MGSRIMVTFSAFRSRPEARNAEVEVSAVRMTAMYANLDGDL